MKTHSKVTHRFIPATRLDYSRRAKNLAWITERPLEECKEKLALAYGYSGARELRDILDSLQHGEASNPRLDVGLQSKVRTDVRFKVRLLIVLAGGDSPEDLKSLSPRDLLTRDLYLTDELSIHQWAFEKLKNALLVQTAAEPEHLLGATPHDYGFAWKTDAGDYSIATSIAGRAVVDAVSGWHKEQKGSNRVPPQVYAERMAALRARHPANPWVIAEAVFSKGHELMHNNGTIDEGRLVLADARKVIGMFERLLSTEQAAKYAGPALQSIGAGYGTEESYYPSSLWYGGMAALRTGDVPEAIRYLERACMMEPSGRSRASASLIYAYTMRDGHGYGVKPQSWSELGLGDILRAVSLIELGDLEAGIYAFAHALIGRLSQKLDIGYGTPPQSLAGLLDECAPVAVAHTDAWRTMTEIAARPAIMEVVQSFVTTALGNNIEEIDSSALGEQINETWWA